MWAVTGVIEGQRQQLTTRVIENGEQPSLYQVRQAASDLQDSTRLVEYLDRELRLTANDPQSIRAFDAVQRWSALAEAECNISEQTRGQLVSLRDGEGALAYFASTDAANRSQPDTVVWHDDTTILIPIRTKVQKLEITYQPDERDVARLARLSALYRSPRLRVETVLEARAYYGTESAVIDYWRKMRRRGYGYRASLRGTPGFVIGRILRRLTTRKKQLHDLSFHSRLQKSETLWEEVARVCPNLKSLSTTETHDDVIVFIHGTVSCCLQSLGDLCPKAPPIQIFRYEHDTFHRLKDNGDELAELITTRLNAKRLLLVGHSRGGLVGRATMTALSRLHYQGEVHLLTFGTPHKGTPLANAANGLVNLLLRLGSHVAGGIPLMSPVVAGFSLVYDLRSLPDGIAVMQEGSEALDLMNGGLTPGPEVRCWGSKFDADKGESGFGIDVEGALSEAMGEIDHDLVVPTESALGYGQPEPVLMCSPIATSSNRAWPNRCSPRFRDCRNRPRSIQALTQKQLR